MSTYKAKRVLQPGSQVVSILYRDDMDSLRELNQVLRSLIKQFGCWQIRIEQSEGNQRAYAHLRTRNTTYVRDLHFGPGVFGFKTFDFMHGMLRADPCWKPGDRFHQVRTFSQGNREESEEIWAQFDGQCAIQFALSYAKT